MVNKETKFEVLEDLRWTLVQDLQPDKHFAFLRSKKVLDEGDCEEISAKTTRRNRAEMFLDILKTKGEKGFDCFCESFIECGKTQLHLLNQILDAFEDKIQENEVEASSRQPQEFLSMEMLSEQLPCPGDPGAPCLPSLNTPYIPLLNGPTPQMNGNMLPNYAPTPPPPYSAYN